MWTITARDYPRTAFRLFWRFFFSFLLLESAENDPPELEQRMADFKTQWLGS
jgi:hypothetical protein